MALPSDVSVCRVVFGPYRDAFGNPLMVGAVGEITPSRQVLHAFTGTVVLREPVIVVIGPDGVGYADIPHTDQDALAPVGSRGFLYTFRWRTRPVASVSDDPRSFGLPTITGATARFEQLTTSPALADVLVPIVVPVELVEELGVRVESAEAAALAAQETTATAAAIADGAIVAASVATEQATAAASEAEEATTAAQTATTAATEAAASARNALITGEVRGDRLYLADADGDEIDAGNVRGPRGIQGIQGEPGPPGDLSPADAIAWPGSTQDLSVWTAVGTKLRTLAGNVVVGVLPPGFGPSRSGTITLIVKQAASGGPYTLTWPASLEWAGDAPAPSMPTAANAELVVHLFWTGSAWRAMVGGVFFP